MEIKDIENKRVKISARSITVKDENDKTCGIVRNVVRFKDLPINKQFDWFKVVKECGVWGHENLLNRFLICDGKAYFLFNTKRDDTYRKFYKDKEWYRHEDYQSDLIRRKNIAEKISEYATVIPCYILS